MRRSRRIAGIVLRYVWTAPNTVLGLLLGVIALSSGGRVRAVRGAVEFHGGSVPIFSHLRFAAITFGHVILAVDESEAERVREHEHVHIRQYERWGVFFLPAYIASSLWQLLRGRRAYRDNCFEREAYALERRGG